MPKRVLENGRLVCKCNVCGYEWFPRTENPVRCPNWKCSSAKWNDPAAEKPDGTTEKEG
jgi:predicted Zn-ribbon and HTH transcriptional regulator